MKKILSLVFLGLITLSSNLFSMEKEDIQVKISSQKQQFTKMDKAKIAIASLGCLYFIKLAFKAYALYNQTDKNFTHSEIPLYSVMSGFTKIEEWITGNPISVKADQRGIGGAGIVSGLLAVTLSGYVYNKLSTLRSNKISPSKKVA